MGRQASAGSWIAAVIVVVAIGAAGVYLVRRAMHPQEPAPPASVPTAPATAATAAMPVIAHPIAQAAAPASASSAPLPALERSDDDVAAALANLAGADNLRGLLVNRQIIARIVATVDALPRRALGTSVLPLQPPRGDTVTVDANGMTTLGEQNSARYAPYMRIVQAVDPQALVDWYVHAYPLFQQAYRQLGYPKGYFNDRLIAAIDDMLAAPEPAQPAALAFSNGYYRYSDPSLESLSAGQKLLLRTGPANESLIKARLRAIRAQLIGQPLPAASGAAAAE